ncbi:phage tail protein [Shewanella salipaludis]|uniref:Phage tail protein n=1 Tax=Shewanella salipaludis TaxID=2723052 RepID=A0A972FSI9_9GAMM|nr:tail fiber protein [Shewanella salipaludis]NMH65418.1 phage tail protein [Shewanella salipaludis]
MAQPYQGDIRMFAGIYAPLNYAFCNGTLMTVVDNEALFSLLGTAYGGDGRTSFALPEMRGRIPVHRGQAQGNPLDWTQGQRQGMGSVTLTQAQLPPHNHDFNVSNSDANLTSPANNSIGMENHYVSVAGVTDSGNLPSAALENSGQSQAHSNMMPYGAINFIIALKGIYPPRN